MFKPDYPFDGTPETGTTMEVAPGVHWLRMPLPFALNHINLWLLEDDDGWTIVDTGINSDEVKAAWQQIEAQHFTDERPVKRVIVTHFHPDHMGLAGWLCERYGVMMTATLSEWSFARMLHSDTPDVLLPGFSKFYHAAGFDDELIKEVSGRAGRYPKSVTPIPTSFVRVLEGDTISINGKKWTVIIGRGHAPEHMCLYCDDLNVMISGDQILPRISPNVSIWPQEPEADPLAQYLGTMDNFRHLPKDTLVLPSHDWPFRGLHERLDDLAEHHGERLDETLAICKEPSTGVDILKGLFTRKLDSHQLFFAVGESLAHAHHLVTQGRAKRVTDDSGVHRFVAI
jgi:glyoxylase-like metal-dependent hydrolase (beta-lactamase superfamily II)